MEEEEGLLVSAEGEWKEAVPGEDEEETEDEEEAEIEMEGEGGLEMKVEEEVWIQRAVDVHVWEREAARSMASVVAPLKVRPEVALKTGALSWTGCFALRSPDFGMLLLLAAALVESRSISRICVCRLPRGRRLPLANCRRHSSCLSRCRHRFHPLFLCIFSPPSL